MQTNNYEEARRYFANNAQHGWKHIESFIVSEQMFERMLKDDFPRGSVIQLGKYADPRTLPRTNVRIKGYPIIVSSGYTETYGVTYIMYEDTFGEEVMRLLGKNVSARKVF
jgi:hypothetical protein